MKLLIKAIGLSLLLPLSACSDSNGAASQFDQDYGALIAQSVRDTMETEKDGMFTSFVSRTKASTGLELEEYAVQCTTKFMNFAGGEVPKELKTLMVEYKKDSDVFKNASQADGIGAIQVSDVIESKIYHCLRAASLECCGQQS